MPGGGQGGRSRNWRLPRRTRCDRNAGSYEDYAAMQQVEHWECDRAGQSVDGVVVHDDSPLYVILKTRTARVFRAVYAMK